MLEKLFWGVALFVNESVALVRRLPPWRFFP